MPDREQKVYRAVIVKPDGGGQVERTIIVTPIEPLDAARVGAIDLSGMIDVGLREVTPHELRLSNAGRAKKIRDRQSRLSGKEM